MGTLYSILEYLWGFMEEIIAFQDSNILKLPLQEFEKIF